MFEPLAAQLLIGLYALMVMLEAAKKKCIPTTWEGIMFEPIVVPFIWLILFLLIVIHDADQQARADEG